MNIMKNQYLQHILYSRIYSSVFYSIEKCSEFSLSLAFTRTVPRLRPRSFVRPTTAPLVRGLRIRDNARPEQRVAETH